MHLSRSAYAIIVLAVCGLNQAAAGEAHPMEPPSDLTIATRNEGSLSNTSRLAMEHELSAIFSSIATLHWQSISATRAGETYSTVIVLRFRGSCRLGSKLDEMAGKALGETRRQNGQLLPFMEINCDLLRETLVEHHLSEPEPMLEYELGVGLARVLAHEVYHVLLNTPTHGESGISKPTLSAADLFLRPLRFQPHQLAQLNAALSRN